jgi:hypothetical protein
MLLTFCDQFEEKTKQKRVVREPGKDWFCRNTVGEGVIRTVGGFYVEVVVMDNL